MDLMAVAYVSTAIKPLSAKELDELLMDARAFNQEAEVTGALLFHDNSFFQYLEGPAEGVNLAYARIKASRLHKDLIELISGPVEKREFSEWHMAFAEAPGSLLQQLANAEWNTSLTAVQAREAPSPGLKALLNFWSRARRGSLPRR
ncbi:MAG TPA: BLUF domain-containing protein [Moraxellaceae bacterium]|nr:BLUF domain-containing protein [Moraxellaceae bacterium]